LGKIELNLSLRSSNIRTPEDPPKRVGLGVGVLANVGDGVCDDVGGGVDETVDVGGIIKVAEGDKV
jgi:hypothetical protein